MTAEQMDSILGAGTPVVFLWRMRGDCRSWCLPLWVTSAWHSPEADLLNPQKAGSASRPMPRLTTNVRYCRSWLKALHGGISG
jgi:hypothetical protein